MTKNTACDTSVLINFLKIERLDLLEKCTHSFFITDHVHDEITNYHHAQRVSLEKGLNQNALQKINVESPEELRTFVALNSSRQLGAGECASIAIALHRGYYLATDDIQAIKKASELLTSSRIVRTQDLVLLMIEEQLLEIDEADGLIEIWATKHRFKLKIKSFNELVPSESSQYSKPDAT